MESNQEPSKPKLEVVVTEQDVTSSRATSLDGKQAKACVSSDKRQMPYIGLGALLLVVFTSVGQMLVLLFADAASASSWGRYLTPNVCLSILNGVASLSIAFAVMQGIAIAWWRRALLGASIKELHYNWNFSTSVTSIFLKYKYFNAIALAALMTKVAIIDGVLFQRAIGTYISIDWREPAPNSDGWGHVRPYSRVEFPRTGTLGLHGGQDGQVTHEFGRRVAQWINLGINANNLDYFVEGCDGAACMYALPGVGFQIECDQTNTTNLFVNEAPRQSNPSNLTIFSVDFDLLFPDAIRNYSRIEMNATWPVDSTDYENTDDTICPTVFTTARCELRPAVMNYTVFYSNPFAVERSKRDEPVKMDSSAVGTGGSYLGYSCFNASESQYGTPVWIGDRACGSYNPELKQLMGVEVTRTIDLPESDKPGSNSSLVGFYLALRDMFTTKAMLSYANASWTVEQTGLLAIQNGWPPNNQSSCGYYYEQPFEEAIRHLNILMLQTSVDIDLWPDQEWPQWNETTKSYNLPSTPAKQYFKDVYYSTNMVFMGIALGLTAVVILCILPSYWGFWQLGRDVTLGPLEIAYAFQGPACDSDRCRRTSRSGC